MRFSSSVAAALLLSIVSAAPTASDEPHCENGICEYAAALSKRQTCNADNLLRNLRDKRYSSSASAFCSKFIQSTIESTVSVAASTTTTATSTPAPIVESVVESSTSVVLSTTTTTSFGTEATVTLKKREAVPYPSFLATTYAPSRVSSACSCLVTPSPAATSSVTVTTGTNTLTDTITLDPSTTTTTSTTTTVTSSTSTATVVDSSLQCGRPGCGRSERTLAVLQPLPMSGCAQQCNMQPLCTFYQVAGSDPNFMTCTLYRGTFQEVYDQISSSIPACQPFRFFDRRCPL
ncbi:MAG: hypothetical protein M1817_000797 [Caeruleum heppii]|nr:MAG: hypothetical protein M1817_000797 [Caeruleum heppii]